MSVLTLTRAKWKTFKTDNNLSKSSLFNKADVGPSIDAFATAYAAFKTSKGAKDLLKASGKLTDLQKAFTKFIAIKELKDEMTPQAKTQIETWHRELDGVMKSLAVIVKKHEPELKLNDAKIMNADLDKMFNF